MSENNFYAVDNYRTTRNFSMKAIQEILEERLKKDAPKENQELTSESEKPNPRHRDLMIDDSWKMIMWAHENLKTF